MKRINAYVRPGPNNTVQVLTEEMLVDLITVHKAVGTPKDKFLNEVNNVWENLGVIVDTSGVVKQ